jgi:ribosomal protein S11
VHEEKGTIVSVERATPADDRIVVGIDGSEQSQLALRWAAYLARVSGSTIEAITAWQPITVAATAGGFGYMMVPAAWDPAAAMEKAAVDTLDQVFGAHRPADLQVTVQAPPDAREPVTRLLRDLGARPSGLSERGAQRRLAVTARTRWPSGPHADRAASARGDRDEERPVALSADRPGR